MQLSPPRSALAFSCLISLSSAWPGLYSDCSVFPELGQPQQRGPKTVKRIGWQDHPPIGLLCEPIPPTTFSWCMQSCSLNGALGRQNCSTSKCKCTEHCMSTEDVCLGQGAPHIQSH